MSTTTSIVQHTTCKNSFPYMNSSYMYIHCIYDFIESNKYTYLRSFFHVSTLQTVGIIIPFVK